MCVEVLGLDTSGFRTSSVVAIRFMSNFIHAGNGIAIHSQVSAVGHTYGRRCMHGPLRAGVRVCQQRVGDLLR